MKFALRCVVAGLFLGALAHGSADPQTPRERWERMSEDEREVMRERYRELQTMDPEARAELLRQSRGVQQRREQVEEALPGPWRERLSELDPHSRRRVVRDHFFDRARELGRRFRERLPDDLVRKLEGADPLERMRLLRQFREERREEDLDQLLGRFADELGVSEEERDLWRKLDGDARHEKAMELGRRFVAGRVEALGLPAWISEEDWAELEAQSDRVFLENWRRLDAGPEYRPDFLPPQSEDRRGGPPGPGAPPEHRPQPRGGPPVLELRPTLEDWLEFHDLPPEARRERVAEKVRARLLQRLEEQGRMSEPELEELRGLRGSDFVDAVRAWVRETRGHTFGPPGRDPGGRRPPQRPRQPRR